jgi:polysaccharide export outer membrane protein
MKRYHQFILFLPLFLILSCSANKPAEKIVVSQKDITSPTPFVLGQSDEIIFNVWRHDELQRTVQIDPSGNLYLPLVGEVKASGLTIPQLRKKICLRLSKYIVNPQVDISVSRLKSQKIHILGEVNSPGSFPLDRRMLVWEAISQAKGFTTDANKENVLLVRSEDGFARITALNLDIQKMLKKGEPKQDFSLRNGDLIYVPPSTIANVERFMLRLKNIISPITEFERGIIMSQDVVNVLRGRDIKGGIVY